MRVYRTPYMYNVISIDLETTVADLIVRLNQKMIKEAQAAKAKLRAQQAAAAAAAVAAGGGGAAGAGAGDVDAGSGAGGAVPVGGVGGDDDGGVIRLPHNLYVKEQGRERMLDGHHLLGVDGSTSFSSFFSRVNCWLDTIVTLCLDRNPMLEIPLDFIQSCTTLRDLRMRNMSMKNTTLHLLDLSSNCIRDWTTPTSTTSQADEPPAAEQPARGPPWYLPRMRSLIIVNISNNKFRIFPMVITQLENLRDLDISFNMISELPEEIGKLTALERFTLVGNHISRFPDEMRIGDLGRVCMLPMLQQLCADWNAVHVVDLSLGENLTHLELAHNDITQLSLLSSLRALKLDHNSIRSIPDTLGELRWLECLSCTDNKLDALPRTIGKLGRLKVLDAHNNSLTELPGDLEQVNVTSNLIGAWADPPVGVSTSSSASLVAGFESQRGRKQSLGSINDSSSISIMSMNMSTSTLIRDTKDHLPPLARSLQKLYLGENCLSGDGVLRPLMIFIELRVLNLSFNDIQDLPLSFFRNMTHLEEIYLSGNKLTSIPAEDFPRLTRLRTLYLNGNKLHTLPQELGKVASLWVLDVGSNFLKYNINNWEFDWNWNFNTNLKYLNLSGNKRLQIKADTSSQRMSRHMSTLTPMLSGFTSLSQLRVLGLMDVTITTTAKDATVDIPDENADRRVRTSLSTVCGMSYGIADSLGTSGYLTMIDLVHEFHGRTDEAIFAMFGKTVPPKNLLPDMSPNPFSEYLHDNFVNVFKTQLACVNEKVDRDGIPLFTKKEGVRKALHWTFLKLNQDIWDYYIIQRKNSQASLNRSTYNESLYYKMGVAGIALYFDDKTIYAANVGDALAVVSRQGVCHEISRKHDPYDRLETVRIRAAEGWLSSDGLVNDEVDVSRSFGYYYLFPPINARPDIFVYDLTEMDEFVIIANRGLWDYVPYQTAVDIARTVARTERPDPMLAAEKLRDFAISYGADGSTMIMVIWVADLFNSPAARSRQPSALDSIILDPQMYKAKKKGEIRDRLLDRLDGEVPPPTGHVTIVFTDIRNSTHLWEANPGMPTAMRLHNSLLRRQLRFCGGYEVKTEGDSFMCSFPTTLAAVWWCLTVQRQLLHESWPLEILECEDGKPIYDAEGRLIARGLSVRMGIHSGNPLCETDLITHRMDYFGPMVNRSARINGSAQGGQIMCSMDIVREINARVFETEEETEYSKLQNPAAIETIKRMGVVIKHVGEVKLKGIELPEILSVLYPLGLEGRHELKDSPADPSASSGSPFRLNVAQIKELGLLSLRIEATSTGRVFKPLSDRKASIQSNPDTEESPVASKTFYGDPNLLLPSINDNSSEADLLLVLDSLVTRLENALEAIGNRYHVPLSPAVDYLMSTLMRDGALDRETLEYIGSILGR
ncbi:hypothetical protein CPB84DRAFT_1768014 [Gymnopilus junonius]|uniref:Adenylate cyclase n=1 Tax=Gymnopilus junonius TaxID=109634 RepID=A0A9P5TS25_GYMJU|nr:hypothetical protein CPB84DRAFT_1768014 [Gymnopilus junonius]